MDRKSQTAPLIGECDHCLRSPQKLEIFGDPNMENLNYQYNENISSIAVNHQC